MTTTGSWSSWPRPSSTGPGFFPFSPEVGTHAADLPDQVPAELALERLRECAELQDGITAARRDLLVGQRRQVLVDTPGGAARCTRRPRSTASCVCPDTVAGDLLDVEIIAARGAGPHAAARPTTPPHPAGAPR